MLCIGLVEGFFSLRQIKRSKEGKISQDLQGFKDLYDKDMKTKAEWRKEKIQGSFIQLPCPNPKPLPLSRKPYLSDGMSPILTDFMRHVKEGDHTIVTLCRYSY
ncbi:hypothetical protein COLO4_09637 [Corchorus olitorius]|uniref:Uncharacterized protein n=1 Tax=Corchorus olitorius TaxID=93759 RepID=A0A1R3KBI1_9ROSI|nr:hypothetical protein COLO4_09637 [Corchorus olitorius]